MGRGSVFHLSFYVTLALATLCLGFAEFFFLKWIPWLLAALGIVGYLAWRFEGRWQLTEPAANSLGLVIAFAMLGWIIFQVPRTDEDLQSAGVPWPAGLLPFLGPLLMVLTAVKLFRPKKSTDFWVLQMLGVMMVTLASVLAGDMEHSALVFLYLVGLVWCLFHYYRVQGAWASLSDEARKQTPLFPDRSTDGRMNWRDGLSAALAWSLLAAVVGGGLFLLAPRHASVQWIPHKLTVASIASRVTTGFDAGMDLNRTGKIELSDEIAFAATGIDAEGKPVDVPSDTYWRGETLDHYDKGRWYSATQTSDTWPDGSGSVKTRILSLPGLAAARNPAERPANMPAHLTYLSIQSFAKRSVNLVLAEAVDIHAGLGVFPHVGDRPQRSGFFTYHEGTDIIGIMPLHRRGVYRYGQGVNLAVPIALQPAERVLPHYRDKILTQTPPAELIAWSRGLLSRQTRLSAAAKTLDSLQRVAPAHCAAVARELTRHFTDSGEYLYSLNLQRIDTSKDPNVDFLLNVKAGHCERYASGLAMTLRALGVPCRIVHGFRGVHRSDDGMSVVRFNQAHSWVQALVLKADDPDREEWLLLDPTPNTEVVLTRWQSIYEWVNSLVNQSRAVFHYAVLDYNSDQQRLTLVSWWTGLTSIGGNGLADPWLWAVLVLASSVFWLYGRQPLARWWHNRQSHQLLVARLPWWHEALDRLRGAGYGIAPGPSQTLLEFAASTRYGPAASLTPDIDALARFVNQVAFGEQPLTSDDERDIAERLERLRTAPTP